jgi:putative restriction endonuclease
MAHIRPLGAPHNGPDVKENIIICLCPNHHVLFDSGAITLADDLLVIGVDGRGKSDRELDGF